jgi:hypothetical protein
MPSTIELKECERFQDAAGLRVSVREVVRDRIHLGVVEDGEATNTKNDMSHSAFIRRYSSTDSHEDEDDCARIKHLGYAASRHVRIYGEEFELLSDPFPQANSIAIRAKAKRDSHIRVLTLPVTITQRIKRHYVPDCFICCKPVDLTTATTDGNGHTVHEDCYMITLVFASGQEIVRAGLAGPGTRL